jgi:hypothetical protein
MKGRLSGQAGLKSVGRIVAMGLANKMTKKRNKDIIVFAPVELP